MTKRNRSIARAAAALAVASLAVVAAADGEAADEIDYGNHNLEWEDGPSSWDEFGHDNAPDVCGLPVLTVEEWEAGRYWEGNKPVIVKNVTDGWAALQNWKKQEIVRLYGDAEATMGEGRLVGETGPDEAGKNLAPTTVKEFVTKHMYNPLKYFFDRKIAIPKGMLEDCHPFPMPTRAFLANPEAGMWYAPSKKAKVRKTPDRELWRDHLAVSIGSDLDGLTFHHHREAWNTVLFGKKRWILWDHARWKDNSTMQWRLTRDWANEAHVNGYEWIRRLYPEPERKREIREFGHDCVQHAGEMMFVPHRWMHMVMNIGDTVAVISEVGLGIGEGKKPEDFLYDPDESSDDSEDSEDDSWPTHTTAVMTDWKWSQQKGRGSGLAKVKGGPDFRIDDSMLRCDGSDLWPGVRVEFDVKRTDEGFEAENVVLSEEWSEDSGDSEDGPHFGGTGPGYESSDDSGDECKDAAEEIDYGNHNLEWEDGPTSWEEFGHDNAPDVCGLPVLTVEEWEAGKYWEGNKPVLVKNVTDGWAALTNWKKQEIVRLYGDAEATMGEGRRVGETGPDEAGNLLTPTTVKEFVTKHMYNPLKYFFDRKIAIPKGMLEDCHPFPMPTRGYLENPDAGATYALSHKKKVRKTMDEEIWRDHLAISIGADLQGLTFHHHRQAWNTVLFGKKRWILWDYARFKHNSTRQNRMVRDWDDDEVHFEGKEWIRQLYPHPERLEEIRAHGHDCIQHAGEMMFVPERMMHMVVNIGDTVSVISEVGLGIGEGKKPEDFLYDPEEESSDDSEGWSEDSEDS